jgi:hypothetical protein
MKNLRTLRPFKGLLSKFDHRLGGALLSFWLFACVPFSSFAQVNVCELTWFDVVPPGTANSPGLRLGQAVAFDSRRQATVLFGGGNALSGPLYTSDTWEWDGANWTKRNSGQAPARHDAAMAYDSDRGVCVMFGGGTNIFQGETPYNDTWEWDGVAWKLRLDSDPGAVDRPPPLEKPMLVYDSVRKRTVLLGSSEHIGFQVSPVMRTWEWDGNSWSVRPNAPPPRIDSAMAFDASRGVSVVFGGSDYSNPGYLNDTWTWDGTTWKLASSGGPPARDQHAMAFDLPRGVVVLFGGSNGDVTAPFADTYEWDGQAWTLIPGANSFGLTPRRLHKMWYETGAQRLIVFGGTVSQRAPDGSYSNTIYDSLFEARPPGWWVDFNYPGQPTLTESGFFYTPYNTLAEAVNAATPGCTIMLKSASANETITITKQLRLEAFNGPVTIGN